MFNLSTGKRLSWNEYVHVQIIYFKIGILRLNQSNMIHYDRNRH